MLTLCIPSPTKRTKSKLENWEGSCSEGTRVGLELAGSEPEAVGHLRILYGPAQAGFSGLLFAF